MPKENTDFLKALLFIYFLLQFWLPVGIGLFILLWFVAADFASNMGSGASPAGNTALSAAFLTISALAAAVWAAISVRMIRVFVLQKS